jgi:uncharacterized protein YoxC
MKDGHCILIMILIIFIWITLAILGNSLTEATLTIKTLEERVERLEHPPNR